MSIEEMQERLKDLTDKVELLIRVVLGGAHSVPPSCVSSSRTFFVWLDEWFDTYKAVNLADNGYKMRLSIDKHIKPNMADKPLHAVTSADIAQALSKIASERMRQIVRCIYNQSFDKAVKLGYISESPMRNVETIKHDYHNGKALTKDEQTVFLSAVKGDEMESLYRFYLLTGCRRSEALAVKRSDIRDGYLHIHGTKTRHSDRVLPLYPALESLIDDIPHRGDILFPYTVSKVRKHFERVRSLLPFSFTLHDLRHTFATRCLEKGVSMKTVQKWLGHSKYGTTADIYSHVTTAFELSEILKLT